MFLRKLRIERVGPSAEPRACPIAWIDNFAMRNFTNDAIFDDTLPVADGILEAGFRVPLGPLRSAMEDWFWRKSYLLPDETLRVTEALLPSGVICETELGAGIFPKNSRT